jgi:hypothetical protein
MAKTVFYPAPAAGLKRVLERAAYDFKILRMHFNQGIAPSQSLDRIAKNAGISRVVPDATALPINDGDQIINVIDNQLQQPEIFA